MKSILLFKLDESHIGYIMGFFSEACPVKTTLLDQIRKRRQSLGLKIQDMPLRSGLTRQQYGKIEAGGNPRLSSIDQIVEGLDCTLLLIPKSKVDIVERILASKTLADVDHRYPRQRLESEGQPLDAVKDDESPWGDL